jgi:hypothetical protein
MIRVTFGTGLPGTGLFLVGHEGSWEEPRDADLWFLVLFFPLAPLARWSVTATPVEGGTDERVLSLTRHGGSRVPAASAFRHVGKALGLAVLSLILLAFAVSRVGSPWGTPLLEVLFGSLLSPGLLGKLGMALELGALLGGAAIPVLVLTLLDQNVPRVPFRSLRAAGRS